MHRFLIVLTLLASCSNSAPNADVDVDADAHAHADAQVQPDGGHDATVQDAANTDIGGADFQADAGAEMGASCEPLPPAPMTRLLPTTGELYYEQVGLGGFAPGEAAIIVDDEGKATVFDVGNDSHVDDVTARLDALGLDVENIVVTHYHADHGDGLEELVDETGVDGRFVFRGLTNLTDAANANTYDETAQVAAALGAGALPLCQTEACEALGETLGQGASRLRFIGANATMAGDRYEQLIGPLLADDGNGENARSVVAIVEHGPFRMLLAGDLTGGGSDTDDVESFYAARFAAVSDLDVAGVDVLHAGHHGRNTSSNATWTASLLPADGNARNVVMGISTVHANSPHQEVLDTLEPALGGGWMWTTRVPVLGASSDRLIDAEGGQVVIATTQGGNAYIIQAVTEEGDVLESQVFRTVRACP